MKNILITGATGLVGSALTRILQVEGYQPVLLARQPLSAAKASSLGVSPEQYIQGDVSKPYLGLSAAAYQKLAERTETIFHLAARVDFKGRSLDDYQDINVGGTDNIIQLARDSGATLHYTSTAFICGASNSLSEEQFDIGQRFRNAYEESKFLAEKRVRQFIAEVPGKTNIYRLAIILGRSTASSQASVFGPFFFMDAVFRMLLVNNKNHDHKPLRILGNPNAHLPMLFADNTAEALVNLAKKNTYDHTFHLVPRTPLVNSRLENLFNQAFGRQVVQWATKEDFSLLPPTRAEKILGKKTTIYADYLNLGVQFGRKKLESVLGNEALLCPKEEEFLKAFGDFLASKEKPSSDQPYSRQQNQVEVYFQVFLPRFLGHQLLENLICLNADFWIEIDNSQTWSLQIRQGQLKSVAPNSRLGTFGYKTDTETYLRIVQAKMSPQEGFFRGLIKLAGNNIEALRTASALEEFFHTFPYNQETGQLLPGTT